MPGVDYGTVSVARKRLSDRMKDDDILNSRFRELENALNIQG